jgi:hypothetical protein
MTAEQEHAAHLLGQLDGVPDHHPCGVPADATAEVPASGTTPGSVDLVGAWIAVRA